MIKNWKKKLLSFALAFVMTAVIIPTLFATPAYAAETWVDVNSASALLTAINNAPADVKTNIRLTANLSGNRIKIPYDKNLVIDLNGYSVSCNYSGRGLFQIYRCPNVTIMNSSSTTSYLTGNNANALYLYNSEDGYGGSNQRWCAVHLKGKISITKTYVAGGTVLYVDTPDVNLGTLGFGSEKKVDYLVNFDANGGTNVPNAVYKRIYVACALPTEAPTRTGYTLKGWNTAANGTGINYDFTYSANAVTTLYAQWSQNQYLTYNANGHGTAPNTVTMTYNTVTNAADAISATGYTFNGWNTKADGTGTAYAVGAEVKKANVDPAATTLYAQWTENTATLAYDANGRGEAPEAVTMKTSAATNAAAAITGVPGYTFNVWNTKADGTGTAYAAGEQVKAANVDPVATTLYAQWTTNTYTVTLNNGGGSGDGSVTATYDAVLPDVTVPTWEKHVFEGYYTEENGEGDRYIGKDGKGVKVWDLTADTTLYAFWKDSAKIKSMDLLLGGDIGMRYHVTVNDTALQESGKATVSIGSKKPSSITITYKDAEEDTTGARLFPFNVSSVQMAEPVTVEFKDGSGNVITSDAKSVEAYYNLVKDSDTTSADQKEMVRTLVDYGYYAQQALSKTRGWSIGSDYKASTLHGSLSSTSNDLKAYRPVISGSDSNVKDIQLSLLLDNKTTLCIYVLTKDGTAPTITVDGASVIPEDNGNGWWLVRIPDIDALNLSTMHTVTANGYTVYLSALSYASVIGDSATIDAMRALLDYYQATLTANHKEVLTSATVEQSEYDYTGQKIKPVLTVMAGNEEVDDYHVEWNGDLINAGTYTGLVTKEGYVGGVTVKVKINPVKVTAPAAKTTEFTYDGTEKTVLTADENALYTVSGNTGTNAASYTAKLELKDTKNTCWSDEGKTTDAKTIVWSIARKKIGIPQAATGLVYNGAEQIGVEAGEGYKLIGVTWAINAGNYTATATLKDMKNTCWNDGTTEDKTIEWRIDKAYPAMLNAVSVTYHPNGGSVEFSGSMNVEGKFNYDPSNGTTFTPNDTQNYNTVTVEADVTKDPTVSSPNMELGN